MTNISKLRSALGGDPSRNNQFRVIINPPSILGISLPEVERLSILAKSIGEPPSTIGTIVQYQGGKPVTFRGDREFGTFSIDYRYDANLFAHDFLYDWNDFLVSHDGFTAARDYADYTGSLTVEKLRQKQSVTDTTLEPEVIKRGIGTGVFPIEIASMGLDQDSQNSAIIVSATFALTDFKWERS